MPSGRETRQGSAPPVSRRALGTSNDADKPGHVVKFGPCSPPRAAPRYGAQGARRVIGPRLWAIVQEAGLEPLGMIGIQPHFGPEDPAAVALLAGVIRTAAPLIERTGVATAEEIKAWRPMRNA